VESEEYEQIPWSRLVAESEPAIDRRLYLIGGAIAVIVCVFLAVRIFGSAAVPRQPVLIAEPDQLTTEVNGQIAPPPTPASPMVISEADLMADVEPTRWEINPVVTTIAEWFVTDFFTRDGSQATTNSLTQRMTSSIDEIPHATYEGPEMFVEWASAYAYEELDVGVVVSVVYRTIHRTPEGFVRDEAQAVAVSLVEEAEGWVVDGFPMDAVVP